MNKTNFILLFLLPIGIFAQSKDSLFTEFIVTFGGSNRNISKESAILVDSLELFVKAHSGKIKANIIEFKLSASFFDGEIESKSNFLTKEQKEIVRKMPLFRKIYFENIIIEYNGKYFNYGTISKFIVGHSCCLKFPKTICNWNNYEKSFQDAQIARSELLLNNNLFVMESPDQRNINEIDTEITIQNYSCQISKYYKETFIDENNKEEIEEHYSDDSTFVITKNEIPLDLKNVFKTLNVKDKIFFYNIDAFNKEGEKIEIAPLSIEIQEE